MAELGSDPGRADPVVGMFAPASHCSGILPAGRGGAEPPRLLEPCVWRKQLEVDRLCWQCSWEGGGGLWVGSCLMATGSHGRFQQDGDVSNTKVWGDSPEPMCTCMVGCCQ